MILALACVAGVGLGLFYFGGLWLTVRRLPNSPGPALLFMGSFVGRTALTVLGFYFVMDGRWERILACLAGFLLARQVLISRLRPDRAAPLPRAREGVRT
jgi:F1F0 ATPase subunit 2